MNVPYMFFLREEGNTYAINPKRKEEKDLDKKTHDGDTYLDINNNKMRQPTLRIDVEKYQACLDDDSIPEEKKRELIEVLWNIIVNFVDLGFGVHPVQQAMQAGKMGLENSQLSAVFDTVNKLPPPPEKEQAQAPERESV